MGQFDTNYIIFTNVEIFKKTFVKENKEYDKTLENILLVKIEYSKLINYLTNMYQSGQGITVIFHPLPHQPTNQPTTQKKIKKKNSSHPLPFFKRAYVASPHWLGGESKICKVLSSTFFFFFMSKI